jgi:hypothetical protein
MTMTVIHDSVHLGEDIGRLQREGIERALTGHANSNRIIRWTREQHATHEGDGHLIILTNGHCLATRNLRETAIAVQLLASAAQGDRKFNGMRDRLTRSFRVREHHGYGHGLQPGTDHDLNCGSCQRDRTAGVAPVIT